MFSQLNNASFLLLRSVRDTVDSFGFTTILCRIFTTWIHIQPHICFQLRVQCHGLHPAVSGAEAGWRMTDLQLIKEKKQPSTPMAHRFTVASWPNVRRTQLERTDPTDSRTLADEARTCKTTWNLLGLRDQTLTNINGLMEMFVKDTELNRMLRTEHFRNAARWGEIWNWKCVSRGEDDDITDGFLKNKVAPVLNRCWFIRPHNQISSVN